METHGSGASRAGGAGIHNEDAFLVEDSLGLYVVCDGASALPGGEIAANVAVGALEEFVARDGRDLDLRGNRAARAIVARALAHAMRAVDEVAGDERGDGPATTMTMLLAHGTRGVIGHRGDSRAYLLRRHRAHQLTVDHELTEAIDADGSDGFDVFGVDLHPGDTIVLCTDGAERVVPDRAIARVAGDLSPRLLASRIVSAAHRLDPEHDATAVVVRVRGEGEPGAIELSTQPRGTTFGHTLAVE